MVRKLVMATITALILAFAGIAFGAGDAYPAPADNPPQPVNKARKAKKKKKKSRRRRRKKSRRRRKKSRHRRRRRND